MHESKFTNTKQRTFGVWMEHGGGSSSSSSSSSSLMPCFASQS
jgi:hypothetical protein